MPTQTRESRFLKLIRPGDKCEQALFEFNELSLCDIQVKLAGLLNEAGDICKKIRLPQLDGHEYVSFTTLLRITRLLSQFPQPENIPSGLRGFVLDTDYIPCPAYRCLTQNGETVEISHSTISPMLNFEKDYPIFRELQWFLRCLEGIIQGIWASKLFREIGDCLEGAPLALTSGQALSEPGLVKAQAGDHWPAWDGPAWAIIELNEYNDGRLQSTWEFCDKATFGSGDSNYRALNQLNQWFKEQTLEEMQSMDLSEEEVVCLLFCSEWGRHSPNLEINLRFSVEEQRFVLIFPMKVHDRYGYNKEKMVIPTSVLNRFLAESPPALKEDMVRILLSEYRWIITRLTSEMIEPDLY